MHFSPKFLKIVASRDEIFSLKFTKYRLAAGLYPDPLGELKRSPRPLSRNKGATSKGRGRDGKGEVGRGRGTGKGGGKGGEGRGREGEGEGRGNLLQGVRGDRRPTSYHVKWSKVKVTRPLDPVT